jgi:hypothetical protein
MSELPTEAVKEFAELYKQEYGIELDPKEAAMRARNLLNLYAAVLLEGNGDTGKDGVPP